MAIESDVLVIGGGLAGSIAALVATDAGASVRLVSGSASSLRQASGLVDVLGYRDGDGPLADPFETLPVDGAHPYGILGEQAIRRGLARFDEVVGEAYEGDHTDRNALVATAGGRLKPTARYPRSVAAGIACADRDCLLAGFESHTGFDAPLAAARLRAAGVPFGVQGTTIEFPLSLAADAGPTRYARALDRNEDGVRDDLASSLASTLDDEARVGLPAILGLHNTSEIRSMLQAHLDADVFEVPTGPPSVPGHRLERRLYEALEAAGVERVTGERVVDVAESNHCVEKVYVNEDRRVPYRAEEYVLATGGLVGGGIDSDRSSVEEPLFGCHVPHPADRTAWYEDDPFGDHEFARFGVRIDEAARPLDANGNSEFMNLRAAGSVLGGADVAAEKSASGVSLASAAVAGTRAGENV